MGYREDWFKNNRSIMGKYRCQHCGGWFDKSEIDVDHIIPKNRGGTDMLINLQGLCRHCNRSKQDKTDKTLGDFTKNTLKVGTKSLIKNILK